MARTAYPRSPAFASRVTSLLARAGRMHQVARHLARAYPEPGADQHKALRRWEAQLGRYAHDGQHPGKARDLEAVVAALVEPKESAAEVTRWLLEGGAEPTYTVAPVESGSVPANLDDARDPRKAVTKGVEVADPEALFKLLESVRSGQTSVAEAFWRIARTSSSATEAA